VARTAASVAARHNTTQTLLGSLSPRQRAALVSEAREVAVRAGMLVYAASDEVVRCGVIRDGLVRIFLATTDGRRVTVRYARAGSLLGAYGILDGRAPLSVEAITDCSVYDIELVRLKRLVESDGELGWLLITEVGRLLTDAYALLASNTLGTLVERVAGHLLELAVVMPKDRLVAPVTQRTLAESVGTAREAVGRVLRDLRADGVVATRVGEIEILDPVKLATIVGRWQAALRP
jgi:CRP/FNR family cyclic AMP-dependent transcriptional regulator